MMTGLDVVICCPIVQCCHDNKHVSFRILNNPLPCVLWHFSSQLIKINLKCSSFLFFIQSTLPSPRCYCLLFLNAFSSRFGFFVRLNPTNDRCGDAILQLLPIWSRQRESWWMTSWRILSPGLTAYTFRKAQQINYPLIKFDIASVMRNQAPVLLRIVQRWSIYNPAVSMNHH